MSSDLLFHSDAEVLDKDKVGAKAKALATLHANGFNVPQFMVVPSETFSRFITRNCIQEKIIAEISRKQLSEMRWEEMWDASLRIRNMIMRQEMTKETKRTIEGGLSDFPRNAKFAVRSSSTKEDGSAFSFAGIHDSFVDVESGDVVEKIKLVWASLWSPSAFTYAKELGHDLYGSKMAVVVQKFEKGQYSGVMFSISPVNGKRFVIEAVPGENQSFVDGRMEPWRWDFERVSGSLLDFKAPSDKSAEGQHAVPETIIMTLSKMLPKIESVFGSPQDIEWTSLGERIFILQSRPITAGKSPMLSGRASFDIGLRRPLDNLRSLREKIDKTLLPDFEAEKKKIESIELNLLSDSGLACEIRRRAKVLESWNKIYWEVFIPYGHGARTFAEFYNDLIRPEDPYEFLQLISQESSHAQKRNSALIRLGRYLASKQKTKSEVKKHGKTRDKAFNALLGKFIDKFSDSLDIPEEGTEIAAIAVKYSELSLLRGKAKTSGKLLLRRFLAKVAGDCSDKAVELLDLAKSSYAMRDNDNLILLRLRKSLNEALSEASKRLRNQGKRPTQLQKLVAKIKQQNSSFHLKTSAPQGKAKSEGAKEKHIQITGQPAGRGIATGRAKISRDQKDIGKLAPGEVLVCDSIEPEMSFIVPLAAAIVERRGGMLVHGAIAAREYGIPCVTGVKDADRIIADGDLVTVDGYLGIVRINKK